MSRMGVRFFNCHASVKKLLAPCAAIALAVGMSCGNAVADPAVTASPSPEPSASLPPDVAQLKAKVDAAAGKRPETERVLSTIAENGRTKTRAAVRMGKNSRFTFEDGPFFTVYGTYDGQAWHQNANGMTVLDQPRPGVEANERRTFEVRHVTSPIVADVIVDVNRKGDGTKTYVDPATSRVVRVEHIAPTETTVTTYDDFRTTAGHVRAWHEHSSDGHAENDSDERIVSITTSGVLPADVAIAPPRRSLVSFPAGMTSLKLPAKLDSDQKFIVRVQVGSRGLDFILDTGASGIVMDEDVARSLGLKFYGVGSDASNAGRYIENEAIVPEMNVGQLAMKDVAVRIIPSLNFASPNEPVKVVGLLGFDFIASLALSLDYERGSVSAIDYDAFKAPADPRTVVLPIRVGNQGPETDVSIDGHLGERFEIDTGGVGGILITDLFTRRYPGLTSGFRSGGGNVYLSGVGGQFATTAYIVPSLRMGTTTFKDFTALVIGSDRLYTFGGFDGVIGPEILQYFTVTTDYLDSTIYLEPNGLGKRSMKTASSSSR